MIKEYPIQLDLKKKLYDSRSITVVSGDKDSNKFMITILDGNETLDITGHTATIIYRNSKGDVYYQNCTIEDAKKGIISVVLALDVISVPGLIKAEIELFKGENRATSVMFHFMVRDSLVDGNEIVPKNSLPNYRKDLAKINREVTDNKDRVTILEATTNKNTEGIRGNKKKVDSVQKQVNQITVKGSIDPEVKQAHVDKDGKTHDTLKQRLDNQQEKVKTIEEELNGSKTIPFSTNGKSVTSYPNNTKGLFYSGARGVKPIYQLVKNGDFHDDFTGWHSINMANYHVSNNILQFTANAQHGKVRSDNFNVIKGHNYLIVARIKSDSHKTRFSVASLGAQYHSGSGKFELIYGTFNHNTSGNYGIDISDQRASGWTPIEVDFIMGFDLTQNDLEGKSLEELKRIFNHYYNYGLTTPTQSYDFVSRGKNKIDLHLFKDVRGVTLDDQILRFSDYADVITGIAVHLKLKPNTLYNFSCYTPDGNVYACLKDKYGEPIRAYGVDTTMKVTLSITTISGDVELILQGHRSDLTLNPYAENIMLIEDDIADTTYKPYDQFKTGFSVPNEFPLLPDSYIDTDTGNYHAIWKKDNFILDAWSYLEYDQADMYRYTAPKNIVFTDIHINDTLFNYCANDLKGKPYTWRIVSDGSYIAIRVPKGETPPSNVIITYKLQKEDIIEDGEQGYQAPSPLPAYQNGDLVVIPKHHKNYQVKDSTKIILDEEICDIDFARTEIDGEVIDLDCTLDSDGKTITIPQTTGLVEIKGTIPDKNCLYPIIEGNVPANLGTIVGNNTLSISDLMEQFNRHKKEQNLINLEMDYRFTIIENA